ncbi:reverse transcriptase N-terminal domain-containing protein [Paraburkholderia youngii]|uniref:reverse transcriptase N-terminal domain-containing protein n=1 Tax=Paraburkholderia youngii TaxID=2782701 RepID=UPI0028AE9A19|nr:reverse transcriptase N-terminal domain-containing protein [Paraburkholderia youngii]
MVSSHQRVCRTIYMEGKQMGAATRARAPSDVTWDGINWADVQRQVRRLRSRMVKAVQAGRHNRVKALQWLLTHSFSGRALAVKRVTETKAGTPPVWTRSHGKHRRQRPTRLRR